MLTRKQYELLEFIDKRLDADGISPSYEEMREAFGLKSNSGIHRLVTALEERGFIRRLPHKARAVEVVRKPRVMGDGGKPRGFMPVIVDDTFPSGKPVAPGVDGLETVALPLYGKIAAGTPIEALRDGSRNIELPVSMLGRGEHYALEIEGDSMIDAGILEGDTVLVRRADAADNGDIVVALVDEREATLKRFRRRGASVALEPANAAHETRIFGPDRVRVQGRLVGLVRKY